MYTHILIPIALDHEHTPDDALAVAKALLKPGGKITAIHAMEPIPAYVSQYLPEQAAENRAASMVAALHEELGDEDVTCVAVQGHAGSAIVDYAGQHDVDLIIVASHRPGLQDYFLGSTAARVVRHAQCPVHVLR